MHELSIVMSIVDIAERQAATVKAKAIDEIELDIGYLSTVEMNAFDFAWQQGIKSTLLENSERKVNRIKGKANCLECGVQFEINNVYDACPVCGEHFINITAGKELRVKSLVVS